MLRCVPALPSKQVAQAMFVAPTQIDNASSSAGTAHAFSEPSSPGARPSRSWLRFLIVGVISSLGYVVVMTMSVAHFGWRPTLGAVLAFVAGTVISYVGNTRWTFQSSVTSRNLARFSAVIAAGFILNVVMAWSLEQLGLHHIFISLVILVTVPIFNYFCHRFWTYAA